MTNNIIECIMYLCIIGVTATDGSNAVIYFPGQGPIELACNAGRPAAGATLWSVNGIIYLPNSLRDGELQNHNVSGTSIVINAPVNNTEYICGIVTSDLIMLGDSIFVYLAGEYTYYHIIN